MNPIQMIFWSALFRTNIPECMIFINNWCNEIVWLVLSLSREAFSIWVGFASVGIMSNAQFLSPWPNIAKKMENSYYCHMRCIRPSRFFNLLLRPRGVGDGWEGWAIARPGFGRVERSRAPHYYLPTRSFLRPYTNFKNKYRSKNCWSGPQA